MLREFKEIKEPQAMKNKVFSTFTDAVADIAHGVTVMIPGFGGKGFPRNLIDAIKIQGTKNLTIISNYHGRGGKEVDHGILVENGQVKKIICAFTAAPHPSQAVAFETLHEAGEIEAELVPQGTLAERIRAGGAGIGAFYTPTGVGTEIAEGKEHREINGRIHILEHPLRADYAFLKAWRSDTFGNLQFRRSARNFNPIMGMAAHTTIVEIEHEIVEVGTIDPDHVHLPGIYVSRIILIPPDGLTDTIFTR
jgi:3-oxoadipate CoA-transferase alpha subunit